jgi:hypothetical protein
LAGCTAYRAGSSGPTRADGQGDWGRVSVLCSLDKQIRQEPWRWSIAGSQPLSNISRCSATYLRVPELIGPARARVAGPRTSLRKRRCPMESRCHTRTPPRHEWRASCIAPTKCYALADHVRYPLGQLLVPALKGGTP